MIEATVTTVRKFIDRQTIKASLGKPSEKHLRAIGLTRNDILFIARMPLPSNGSLALSDIRKSRAGNW